MLTSHSQSRDISHVFRLDTADQRTGGEGWGVGGVKGLVGAVQGLLGFLGLIPLLKYAA